MRRPSISLALAAAFVGAVLTAGCSSPEPSPTTTTQPSASSVAAPPSAAPIKGIPEDPGAIVKASDLKTLAGVCILQDTHLLDAQGAEAIYQCDKHRLDIVELSGQQAVDTWKVASKKSGQTPLSDIGKHVLLTPGTGIAIYKDAGDDSMLVTVMATDSAATLDDGALKQLGKLIAERIKA